jgi:hypothetical protein
VERRIPIENFDVSGGLAGARGPLDANLHFRNIANRLRSSS